MIELKCEKCPTCKRTGTTPWHCINCKTLYCNECVGYPGACTVCEKIKESVEAARMIARNTYGVPSAAHPMPNLTERDKHDAYWYDAYLPPELQPQPQPKPEPAPQPKRRGVVAVARYRRKRRSDLHPSSKSTFHRRVLARLEALDEKVEYVANAVRGMDRDWSVLSERLAGMMNSAGELLHDPKAMQKLVDVVKNAAGATDATNPTKVGKPEPAPDSNPTTLFDQVETTRAELERIRDLYRLDIQYTEPPEYCYYIKPDGRFSENYARKYHAVEMKSAEFRDVELAAMGAHHVAVNAYNESVKVQTMGMEAQAAQAEARAAEEVKPERKPEPEPEPEPPANASKTAADVIAEIETRYYDLHHRRILTGTLRHWMLANLGYNEPITDMHIDQLYNIRHELQQLHSNPTPVSYSQ